jgi:Amt family ammonium transporter
MGSTRARRSPPTITPASGFVGPIGALVIGAAAGLVCYWMVGLIKKKFHIDDSLDVFGVHGVGGMLGVVLTAIFVAPALGGRGFADGMGMGRQLWVQVFAVIVTVAWSGVLSYIILKVVDMITGLRVSVDRETEGLDITSHGERGYNL